MAKLGATNTLALAPRRSSSSAIAKPVVPMTTWMPAATASRVLASAVEGIVKSTRTSGAADSASPNDVPRAGSTRATSSMSSAPSTASHTVAPIRPAAPATATLMTAICPDSADRDLGELRRHPAQGLVEALGVGSDPGRRQPLGIPQFLSEGHQVSQRDRVDAPHHLIQRHQRRLGQDLGPEPVHPRSRGLQGEYHAALEVLLGAVKLLGGGRLGAEARELGADHRQR